MKSVLLFVCFGQFLTIFLWNSCNAGTYSMNASDPTAPGCFYEDQLYLPGEHEIPGGCLRIVCSVNGWMSVHSCIDTKRKECVFRGKELDLNQKFPECCKRKYLCKGEDGKLHSMINY